MVDANNPSEAYRTYGPALLRKAERILLNPDDASDVVQALFVELIQRGPERPELPYLYRAVTNRALNLIRDRDNRQRLLGLQEPSLRGPVRTHLEDEVVNLDLLAKLVDRLDAKCLEVLTYCYIDDMSHDEAAELLGISRRAIGKRVAKIRKSMHGLTAAERSAL